MGKHWLLEPQNQGLVWREKYRDATLIVYKSTGEAVHRLSTIYCNWQIIV